MKGSLKFSADIEVKSNVFITARERGKIVARREGHNIFLDGGREWLSKLIAYLSFSPDVPESEARIRYMGFGIGGTRQIAPAFADTAPLTDYTPVGSFAQTDTDPTVLALERPVRVSGSSGSSSPGDLWVGQVQAPPVHPTVGSTTFRRLFSSLDVSYSPYNSVPLSEVGLFLSDVDPNFRNNIIVAYDTFDTLSKTSAFELEVVWTLRFG
jgi:hypothetical protein